MHRASYAMAEHELLHFFAERANLRLSDTAVSVSDLGLNSLCPLFIFNRNEGEHQSHLAFLQLATAGSISIATKAYLTKDSSRAGYLTLCSNPRVASRLTIDSSQVTFNRIAEGGEELYSN
jgi:hypothetical protein